jgi:hypothetical protein
MRQNINLIYHLIFTDLNVCGTMHVDFAPAALDYNQNSKFYSINVVYLTNNTYIIRYAIIFINKLSIKLNHKQTKFIFNKFL